MPSFGVLMMCVFSSFSYNKRELDFSSLTEYNDYLEQMEDIGEMCYIYIYSVKSFICLPLFYFFKYYSV